MIKKRRKKTRRKTYKSYKHKKQSVALRQAVYKIFKLILLLGAASFVIYYFIFRPSPEPISTQEKKVDIDSLAKPEAIDYTLDSIFKEVGLLPSWINKKGKTYRVRVPQDVPVIVLIHKIINKMEDLDCKLIKSSEDFATRRSTLEIGFNDELVRKLIINHDLSLIKNKEKIAIIIDDFGYSESDDVKKLLEFPYQISIAIIPGVAKSLSVYNLAHKSKKETLIHFPMEAVDDTVEYTDYTIYTNMSDEEITRRVKKAIKDFPDSKGINNHMGSKATSDNHVMEIFMQELKKNNKYFIDSKTTNQSVAYQIARRLKVLCSENNIFLERERNDSEDYLRKKLTALTKIAEKKGSAIAIGHPYKNTVKVLTEEIPKLAKQGFVFVPASEIVK